jgi:hypothetical protein
MLFRTVRTQLLTMCLILLSACGGGGGGTGGAGSGLTMALSPASLSFATTDANAPPAQSVQATFTGTASGTLYVLITPADPSLVTVDGISASGNTGHGLVTPAAPSVVGPGSHSTTISVVACIDDPTCATNQVNGSPQTVSVTYTVAGVSSSAASLSYSIGNTPVASDYIQTFNVTTYPAQSWTAVSDVAWLTLTPPSGSGDSATEVSANLDQTQVGALANGTYTATVSLASPTGLSASVPVTLTIARTKVNVVAPYVATAGTSDSVIIRGEHLDLVTVTGVNFGTTAATAFSVVSDTEIHATYPPLSVGPHMVHLVNSQNVDRTTATLQAIAAPAFAAAAIAYPADAAAPGYVPRPVSIMYDAERQAVFVSLYGGPGYGGTGYSHLVRFAYDAASSGWISTETSLYSYQNAFALSIDGAHLLAANFDGNGVVVAPWDPVTMLPGTATTYSGPPELAPSGMAVANDGIAIIPTASPYSELPILGYSAVLGTLVELGQPTIGTLDSAAVVGSSADGGTVLAFGSSQTVPHPMALRYDTASGQLTETAVALGSNYVNIDRHGDRMVLNQTDPSTNIASTSIYDNSITLLGSLPLTTVTACVSPDGQRAYAYDTDGTVRTYDLAAAPVAGTYAEILPAKILTGSPTAALNVKLVVSPDGGTLFVATGTGLYIVPVH